MNEEEKQRFIDAAVETFRDMFYYDTSYAEKIIREGIDTSCVVSTFRFYLMDRLEI